MGKRSKDTITLGSGKLYIDEFDKTTGIPEDSVIETEEKRAGWIKGGAELSYEGEFYDAKDDLGKVMKRMITDENVTFKSGIMTWNTDVLNKLVSTGTVEEDTSKGKRTIKIGGTSHYSGKSYVIRFLHEDAIDGNLRITIVGQNTAGFTLTFAKDAETVIDAEFSALPSDAEGTLVTLVEDIDKTV